MPKTSKYIQRMTTPCRYCDEDFNEVSELPTVCKPCDEAFMTAMHEEAPEGHSCKRKSLRSDEWPEFIGE